MKLTNEERETIIVFNEKDEQAEVFTYNGRMLRDLDQLLTDRPDDVRHVRDNGNGGHTYRVPKKWVKIRANRIVSDEEKARRAKIMMKNRAKSESTAKSAGN